MTIFYHEYNQTKALQFRSTDLKPFENPKSDLYEVIVVHMHGDADYFTTKSLDFKSESEMLDFVNFILRCMVAYPYGMGGADCYDHIDGFDKHGNHLLKNNDTCEGHATPTRLEVVYYDKLSCKYDVVFHE